MDVSPSNLEINSDWAENGFGSQKSRSKCRAAWYFCKAVTSAGRYPRRPCVIIRLLCWQKKLKPPGCPPLLRPQGEQTQTGLGGNEASNWVLLLAGWVGGFWHSQPIPKSHIFSWRVGRIPVPGNNSGNKACAWGYFLPWRDIKEAAPEQWLEGCAGFCARWRQPPASLTSQQDSHC